MIGAQVTIIDGFAPLCVELESIKPDFPWKNSTESLSKNSLVVPMNETVKEFGLCVSRLIGLNFQEGHIQKSLPGYEIAKHNHISNEHPVYALFYIEAKGSVSTLRLYDPDIEIERTPGRLIVIPDTRVHSVSATDSESTFLRLVFTRSPSPFGRNVNKKALQKMKGLATFTFA